MKFSIVITTYNRLELLKRAIASSLAQTVPCEVVVVDDCSQDGTADYVRTLSDQLRASGDDRLVYHRNAENLGHSQSVNAGVQRASGDWIKGLDDDDYLAKNCIEVLSAAIALRPQASICSCQAAQVNEREEQLSLTDRVGPGEICYIPQEDIHCGMLLEQVPFGTPVQVAYRRDAFLRSGGWDSSLDANFDDIDSWVRIAQFGDAIFVNRCLAYRTVWPGAYNRRFSLAQRLNTHLAIKRKIHALVPDQHRSEIPDLRALEYYLKLHWAVVALRQGDWWQAVRFAYRAAWSPTAWQLLLQRRQARSKTCQQTRGTHWANSLNASFPLNQHRLRWLRNYLALRSGWRALRAGKVRRATHSALSATRSWVFWRLLAIAMLALFHISLPLLDAPLDQNRRLLRQLTAFINAQAERSLANVREMRLFLKLRLACLAWQEGRWGRFGYFVLLLLPQPQAWQLAFKLARLRYQPRPTPSQRVRKVMLLSDS